MWTNTYVCLDCKTVTDLAIEKGQFKSIRKNESEHDKILDGQNCEDCGGRNFEIWDSKKKSCPKCGTTMKPDPNGMTMNWD